MIEQAYTYLRDKGNIDLIIVLLVIAAGYFQSTYLRPFIWFKRDLSYDATLKTAVVGAIFTLIYVFLAYKEHPDIKVTGIKWFVSYASATSFYEILLRLFKKRVGND